MAPPRSPPAGPSSSGLHTGATRVVANCAVLTEGFDEPSVDCIIVARPTQSAPLYQQMLGRGTRTYPGKTDCLRARCRRGEYPAHAAHRRHPVWL